MFNWKTPDEVIVGILFLGAIATRYKKVPIKVGAFFFVVSKLHINSYLGYSKKKRCWWREDGE